MSKLNCQQIKTNPNGGQDGSQDGGSKL